MNWYLNCFKNNFMNFNGRAGINEYSGFKKIQTIIIVIFILFFKFYTPEKITLPILILFLYLAVNFLPSLSLSVRRLHDMDKSGKAYIVLNYLVPLVAFLIYFLALHFATSIDVILLSMSYISIFIKVFFTLIIGVNIYYFFMMRKNGDEGENIYGAEPVDYLEEDNE